MLVLKFVLPMIFLSLDYIFEMKKDLFIFNQFSND